MYASWVLENEYINDYYLVYNDYDYIYGITAQMVYVREKDRIFMNSKNGNYYK